MYFAQGTADGNDYNVHMTVDDVDQQITYALDFGTNGVLADDAVTTFDLAFTPIGADPLAVTIDFFGSHWFWCTVSIVGHYPKWLCCRSASWFPV